jgi:cysteine desulfurase/selenocysteine lyase
VESTIDFPGDETVIEVGNANAQAITRRDLATGALYTWIAGQTGIEGGRDSSGPSRWRKDFPALNQQVGGKTLVYLDSAATTQRPKAVIDALVEFYSHDNANPGGALHSLARRAYERYEEARGAVAAFIHAREANEIVWVRGTTEGINLVASSWGEDELRSGDEILLTLAEHASNLLPWRLLAARRGALIRYVEVDDAGRLDLEDLDRKLSPRTRLLAFSHVSNVTGYINPAREICASAHRAGALVMIDAAQSVPHVRVDVQSLGCDFLAFSSHKMLGPMGIGVLWARRELLQRMRPYQAGSNMAHEIDTGGEVLEEGARKFGAGTPNVSGPIGLVAAMQYMEAVGREAIEKHEEALTRYALGELQTIPGLRLLGPREPEHRLPVFSFSIANREPLAVLRHLDARGIAVRAGDLAALPLLKRFGVSGAIRASCFCYTQLEEIDRMTEALRDLADEEKGA